MIPPGRRLLRCGQALSLHRPYQSSTLRPRFHWLASIRTQMTLAFALLAALMFTLLERKRSG